MKFKEYLKDFDGKDCIGKEGHFTAFYSCEFCGVVEIKMGKLDPLNKPIRMHKVKCANCNLSSEEDSEQLVQSESTCFICGVIVEPSKFYIENHCIKHEGLAELSSRLFIEKNPEFKKW